VKEKGKGKAKPEGPSTGPSTGPRTTRTGIHELWPFVDVAPSDVEQSLSEGARTPLLWDKESLEAMLERSERALRDMGVKLNELSGSLLEIGDLQASIRGRTTCSL
jgi:hypothetical protein